MAAPDVFTNTNQNFGTRMAASIASKIARIATARGGITMSNNLPAVVQPHHAAFSDPPMGEQSTVKQFYNDDGDLVVGDVTDTNAWVSSDYSVDL